LLPSEMCPPKTKKVIKTKTKTEIKQKQKNVRTKERCER
jgi:hypothetical protein